MGGGKYTSRRDSEVSRFHRTDDAQIRYESDVDYYLVDKKKRKNDSHIRENTILIGRE